MYVNKKSIYRMTTRHISNSGTPDTFRWTYYFVVCIVFFNSLALIIPNNKEIRKVFGLSDTQKVSFESSIWLTANSLTYWTVISISRFFQKLLNRCFIAEIHLQRLFSAYAGMISAALSNVVYSTCKQWHAN